MSSIKDCISSTSLEDYNQAFIHHSVPLVTDLLETCVDEVLRVSVPMVTPEEVGPIGAHSSTVAEETLSLTGELIYANTVRRCTSWSEVMHVFTSYYFVILSTEAAARLKQLEIESTPVPAPSRSNINLNMNNQVSLVIRKTTQTHWEQGFL